jgi:hypothetical protein
MYGSILSLTSALDGVGGQRHALAALLPGKTRYPLYGRLGGPQGRPGRVRNISPPTGIRSPDRPARSESLYRMHYSGPPRRLYPRERNPTLIVQAVGWASLSVCEGSGKSRTQPAFEPQTVQPVRSRYTDSAIPAARFERGTSRIQVHGFTATPVCPIHPPNSANIPPKTAKISNISR